MITAVIPTWNRRALLERALAGLRCQSIVVHALVVDNGSTDGTADAAESAGVPVLRLPRNEGFAVAVNRGLREAVNDSEYVAILNNDVDVAQDWAARLVNACERSGAHFATGKILSAADPARLDGTFDLLARSGCAWRAGTGQAADHPVWSEPRRIRLAPLTAALFRAETFQNVGFLDEDYGSYLEDVDFGLRCALNRCEGVYEPSALARHEGSATLGRWNPATVRLIARNQVVLTSKHLPSEWARPIAVGQGLWGLLAARHGCLAAWCAGKSEGLRWRQDHALPEPATRARQIISESEAEMHELQRVTGNDDSYWRWYWRLSGARP